MWQGSEEGAHAPSTWVAWNSAKRTKDPKSREMKRCASDRTQRREHRSGCIEAERRERDVGATRQSRCG